MHDPNCFPRRPGRSEALFALAVAFTTYAALQGAWGAACFGVAVAALAALSARMRGPFRIGPTVFKGELDDPGDDRAPGGDREEPAPGDRPSQS